MMKWGLVACLAIAIVGSLYAESGPDPVAAVEDIDKQMDALQFATESKRSEIQEKHESRRKALVEKYVAALNKIGKEFQKKGDLDSMLSVRDEIEHAKKHFRPGESEFPPLEQPREILAKELKSIAEAEQAEVKAQAESEIDSLEALKVALTKAGRIEEATEIKAKIDRRRDLVSVLAPADEDPAASANQAAIEDGPLFESAPVHGDHRLAVGHYDLGGRQVLVGTRNSKDNPAVKGNIEVLPGSSFRDGEILVRTGHFTAERSDFSRMTVQGDLGGAIEASECLFRDSVVGKGGGWWIGYFSSKQTFTDCVFSGSFVERWPIKALGVKLKNCTFHDIQFTPVEYREDASEEAAHEWMTIEDCHFIDCEIPESFLIATKDCVFENCTFPGPEEYPTTKKIRVTVLMTETPSSPPPTSENTRLQVEAVSPLKLKAGTKLEYEYADGALRRNAP